MTLPGSLYCINVLYLSILETQVYLDTEDSNHKLLPLALKSCSFNEYVRIQTQEIHGL